MASDNFKELVLVTREQRDAIRKDININTEEEINESINDVITWFETQEHLPRIRLDTRIVERILISRKGSVPKTKEKIDSMFTIRTKMPELARPRDILHPDIQKVFKVITSATMPRLNHDNCRVTILKYNKNGDAANYNLADTVKYVFMTVEYRLKHEYSAGERYILDVKEKTWRHYAKDSPYLAIKIEKFMKAAYGLRIRGLHIINCPSYLNTLIAMFKLVLPKKLMERLYFHKNLDDLYEHIDRDILPTEYGGSERSIDLIMDEWNKEFSKENVRNYLISQESLCSDESKRIK